MFDRDPSLDESQLLQQEGFDTAANPPPDAPWESPSAEAVSDLGLASESDSAGGLDSAVEAAGVGSSELFESAIRPYVDRWNRLISQTNWHKGRIIAEWRQAMIAAGAPPTGYSDEAWASRVGGITSQHVGRLRRVWERFGQVYSGYRGLYWSHFQAALDWDDAEMWLEGAVQNGWSISQMRAQRVEALGRTVEVHPAEPEPWTAEDEAESDEHLGELRPVADDSSDSSEWSDEFGDSTGDDAAAESGDEPAASSDAEVAAVEAPAIRPFESLPPLPPDVGEAFEAMKLAIVSRRVSGWSDISRDDMLSVLEALRQLTLAPQ